jgi:hypothetical protein
LTRLLCPFQQHYKVGKELLFTLDLLEDGQ